MCRYSFDNYIVTQCNSVARDACVAFAKSVGEKYSPLLLCGKTGTGKTHLAAAIVNLIEQEHDDLKVEYVSAKEFANTIIEAMMEYKSAKNMQELRAKYCSLDVLVFDDIDWLQDKEATRAELFFIIDSLIDKGKKVIMTSGTSIRTMYLDSSKKKSRIDSYSLAMIGEPDDELLSQIICTFTIENALDKNIKEFLKSKSENSIRKLQGMMRTLEMHMEVSGITKPTIEQVKNIIEADISHKYRISV